LNAFQIDQRFSFRYRQGRSDLRYSSRAKLHRLAAQ